MIVLDTARQAKKTFRLFDQIIKTRQDIELAEIVLSRLTGEKSIPDALRTDIREAKQEIDQLKQEIDTTWEIISYLGRFTYRSSYDEKEQVGANGSNQSSEGKGLIP